MNHPRVFISYCHTDEIYEQKMFEFANKLRKNGIDANIDLFEECPAEGWPRWMENQIRNADFVLIVCSEAYSKKFYADHGKGVTWEIQIIYQTIYDSTCETQKFIPVFWNSGDEQYILDPLKPYTYYNLSSEEGYQKLWRRLAGVKKYEKAELGNMDINSFTDSDNLPEKPQRTMFFTTPINLELWNAAKWHGMVYLLTPPGFPPQPPVLGFMYRNFNAAIKIFDEWKNTYDNVNPDDYMDLTFITPPLPPDCYVKKDKEHNYGKGYFVHLGPNIDQAMKRAISIYGDKPEPFLAMVSRFTWVDEQNGSTFRETFQKQFAVFHSFRIIPVSMKNDSGGFTMDNLMIGHEHSLELHNVSFKKGIEIKDDDPCKVVLNPPNKTDYCLKKDNHQNYQL